MRVIGAGVGRTGTSSLKLALEQLLDGPCYHMLETIKRPDDVQVWRDAISGAYIPWHAFLHRYEATVDWPGAAFWSDLANAFPDALVLLSTRSDADVWYQSAAATIFQAGNTVMMEELLVRFTSYWNEPAVAKLAYEEHNAAVRSTIKPDRLIDWQPGDGWGPICTALALPVPSEPFPHVNTTAEFRAVAGLDG